MAESRVQKAISTRNIIGIILILLGGLFLLKQVGYLHLDLWDIIFSIPFFILVIGTIITINSNNKTFGTILIFIGAFFLIPEIFPRVDFDTEFIFPIIIIALGVYIIFRSRKSSETTTTNSDTKLDKDMIDDIAIFGGGTKIIYSDNFKGGNVTAIFGGSEIDLTNSKLAEGDNVIDVLCLFGGSTFIVPKNWNVRLEVTSILGGFSNKVMKAPSDSMDQTRSLVIKGLAMFGGGEVKNYY